MRFVLNQTVREVDGLAADMTLLRYLREQLGEQKLTGSKEGCGSGDCGACTVLVSRDGAAFVAVNACICPLGSLQDCDVITIEGLAGSGGELHPVQAALVECHGSQCGFCTPGFVMSLVGLQLGAGAQFAQADEHRQRAAVIEAISGNLCRCTGYRPIVDAGIAALKQSELINKESVNKESIKKEAVNKETVNEESANKVVRTWAPAAPLAGNSTSKVDGIAAPALLGKGGASYYWQPQSETELQRLFREYPHSRLIAGGTDLMLEVTQQYKSLPQLIDVNAIASLQKIESDNNEMLIGAAVSYSALEKNLKTISPEFVALLARLGSRQIRNRGTLGGNICNASPIADAPPYLLVMDAELEIVDSSGNTRRELLTHFYRDYKNTALAAGEYLARICIARERLARPLKLFKISKRYEDDISAVMGAFCWSGHATNQFKIAFGGMASIPKRATATEQFLSNANWYVSGEVDENILAKACDLLRSEFSPLSDVRASAAYRMDMACNLLKRACYEFAAEAAGKVIEARLFSHA